MYVTYIQQLGKLTLCKVLDPITPAKRFTGQNKGNPLTSLSYRLFKIGKFAFVCCSFWYYFPKILIFQLLLVRRTLFAFVLSRSS